MNNEIAYLSAMKWMFILLFPFISYAQTLKPGVYRDLKVEKPIVLDTGSYTFIGLEMKNLGKGIWLDGRKAKSLSLQGCRFGGNGSGTAVATNGNAQISKSTFTKMETGIQVLANEGTIRTLTLTANTFTNLTTAIDLQKQGSEHGDAVFDITLRCNEFVSEEQTGANPITRRGLVIGEGVQVRASEGTGFNNNQIGGANQFNTTGEAYPNANVWPVDPGVNRSILPVDLSDFPQDVNVEWPNCPNWMPIDNQSTPITYFRFFNEFIWNGQIPNVTKAQAASPNLYSVLRENNLGPINQYLNTVAACGTQFDEVPILFPTRIAIVDSSAVFTGLKINNMEEMLLCEAIPNPAEKEARISILLQGTVQEAVLQFVNLGDGKVLQTQSIQARGKLEAVLDLQSAPAGVYGYRLIVDGKPIAVKKLVVVK